MFQTKGVGFWAVWLVKELPGTGAPVLFHAQFYLFSLLIALNSIIAFCYQIWIEYEGMQEELDWITMATTEEDLRQRTGVDLWSSRLHEVWIHQTTLDGSWFSVSLIKHILGLKFGNFKWFLSIPINLHQLGLLFLVMLVVLFCFWLETSQTEKIGNIRMKE